MKEQSIWAGPDGGYRVTVDGRSMLEQLTALSKAGEHWSDQEAKELVQIFDDMFRRLKNRNVSRHAAAALLDESSAEDFSTRPFFKHVTRNDWEKYISTGCLRLGSLEYYRKIEDIGRADEYEGYSYVILRTDERDLTLHIVSGFNWWILCGTDSSSPSAERAKKFGEVLLRIADVPRFMDAVAGHINAKRSLVRKIVYADHKTIISRMPIGLTITPENEPRLHRPDIFRRAYESSVLTSIFCKPARFSGERELRIGFELARDVENPYIDIVDPALLEFIEVVETN